MGYVGTQNNASKNVTHWSVPQGLHADTNENINKLHKYIENVHVA